MSKKTKRQFDDMALWLEKSADEMACLGEEEFNEQMVEQDAVRRQDGLGDGEIVNALAVRCFLRAWHFSARVVLNLDAKTSAVFAASDPLSQHEIHNPWGSALVVRIAPGILEDQLGRSQQYILLTKYKARDLRDGHLMGERYMLSISVPGVRDAYANNRPSYFLHSKQDESLGDFLSVDSEMVEENQIHRRMAVLAKRIVFSTLARCCEFDDGSRARIVVLLVGARSSDAEASRVPAPAVRRYPRCPRGDSPVRQGSEVEGRRAQPDARALQAAAVRTEARAAKADLDHALLARTGACARRGQGRERVAVTNVASFVLFDTCSAFWPASHLNHRCHCATTHGQAMGGWSVVKGRQATKEEFAALGQHNRALGATLALPGKKRRIKAGRDNGPRGKKDRGKVFAALSRSNYPGTTRLQLPDRGGCWR